MVWCTTWRCTLERLQPVLANQISRHQATLSSDYFAQFHVMFGTKFTLTTGLPVRNFSRHSGNKESHAWERTVRINRVQGCTMPSDANMKKQGRGTTEIKTATVDDVELRAIKWFDNRGVVRLSSFATVDPVQMIQHWDKKNKEYAQIKCPSAVLLYNQFMSGVDLLDSLLALYRISVRSKKWYHRL